jgi:hypothetical protein
MGHRDEVTGWFEKWQAAPEGDSDDCPACEADRRILYLLETERTAEALDAAVPILKGEIWCDETPITLTRLIGPALKHDRRNLASAILHATSRPVRRVPNMLSALSAHVVHRLFEGDMTRSHRLATLALAKAKQARNDLDRFNVYRACGMWAALAVIAGARDLTLPSKVLPGGSSDSPAASLPDAAAICFQEASRIATRFDARNGTTRYAERLGEMEETIRKVVAIADPLRRDTPGDSGPAR